MNSEHFWRHADYFGIFLTYEINGIKKKDRSSGTHIDREKKNTNHWTHNSNAEKKIELTYKMKTKQICYPFIIENREKRRTLFFSRNQENGT